MKGSSSKGFFKPRVAASFALFFTGVALAMMAWSSAAGTRPVDVAAKIAPEGLAETAGGGKPPTVIMLGDQGGVKAADQIKGEDARGWVGFDKPEPPRGQKEGPL